MIMLGGLLLLACGGGFAALGHVWGLAIAFLGLAVMLIDTHRRMQ